MSEEKETKVITLKVNTITLKSWKQYCLNNDITMTSAIKKAMREMIERGELKPVQGEEISDISQSNDGKYFSLQISAETLKKMLSK